MAISSCGCWTVWNYWIQSKFLLERERENFLQNTSFITHGASEASGVRNFWHLSAKILYTVGPKTATSPFVHFEIVASPTEKITSLLHVSVLSYFEIVEIISPNTREITWSVSFAWTTDNFQVLLKSIFSWVYFSTFCWQT